MLTQSQFEKLNEYCAQNMPDGEIKDIYFQLIDEYEKYIESGSPEECMQRKEWMSMSIDDVRIEFNNFVKEMRKEVEIIRYGAQVEIAAANIKRRRGRPRKN